MRLQAFKLPSVWLPQRTAEDLKVKLLRMFSPRRG